MTDDGGPPGPLTEGNGGSTAAAEAVHRALLDGEIALAPARHVHRPPAMPMSPTERRVLGWLMFALPLLLFTQLVALWPSALAATTTPSRGQPTMVWLFGLRRTVLSPDGSLLLLVALVGALASFGESSFRFVASAGRDELTRRWTWSYIQRPVQGAILATIVYFALRAGLLGSDSTKPINPYGLAAFAGLVGLFTRQAFQKLKEVFNTLWGVEDLDADIHPDPHAEANGAAEPRPAEDPA